MAGTGARTQLRLGPKVNTGILALDNMLGGIPSGSLILMTGEPGSGFDILAQQVLYLKASTGEAPSTYVAIERPTDDLMTEMSSREWEVDRILADKSWEFVDGYIIRQNIIKGIAGPKALLDLLQNGLPRTIRAGRYTVVDSFSYFLQNFEFKDLADAIDSITYAARESGGIHFLLLVAGLHDQKTVLHLSHLLDGHLEFSLDPAESEPLGAIRIKKLRKANHVIRTIPYRITNTGITIETTVRMA